MESFLNETIIFILSLVQLWVLVSGVSIIFKNGNYRYARFKKGDNYNGQKSINSSSDFNLIVYALAIILLFYAHMLGHIKLWYVLLIILMWWSLVKTVHIESRHPFLRNLIPITGGFFIILVCFYPSEIVIYISTFLGIIIVLPFVFMQDLYKYKIEINIEKHAAKLICIFVLNFFLATMYSIGFANNWIIYVFEIALLLLYRSLLENDFKKNLVKPYTSVKLETKIQEVKKEKAIISTTDRKEVKSEDVNKLNPDKLKDMDLFNKDN